MYPFVVKRLIDIAASSVCLFLLTPVMILVALAVYLQDFASPLFCQKRVGREEREFTIFKFRSMPVGTANVASNDAKKLEATWLGKIIRRTNLDELPQFFNILKGDMSLIGPRPSLPTQTNLIQLRRDQNVYRCRPGLTGWAQVNAYDDMPEIEKAKYDGEYAVRVSLWFDCKIVLMTLVYLTKKPPTY